MLGMAEMAAFVLNEVSNCQKTGARQKITVKTTPTQSRIRERLIRAYFSEVEVGSELAINYFSPITLTRLFESKNAAIATAEINSKNVTTTKAAP